MDPKYAIEAERQLQVKALEARKQYLEPYDDSLPVHQDRLGYVLMLTQLINECQTRIDYLSKSLHADKP
ncbi:MAG: hypothetical protein OXG15_10255 [Gammaproteobacteria bacterium]|nr:hypothetical protein [Gammaproteobacteria bacterium]